MIHYHRVNIVLMLLTFCYGSISGLSQEKERRVYPLEHPELIVLKLLPRQLSLNEDPEALRVPYTTKSNIYFRLEATNRSLQKITLCIIDTYVQDRPELFRDGQIVPYKAGIEELLRAKEKDPYMRLVQHVNVDPDDSKEIEYFYVNYWYESLQPGHYQLSIKHRFEPRQDWIDSSSITFEVVSKNGQ